MERVPLPLLPTAIRGAGVLAIAALIFYGSLVTVPETLVDDAQPEFVPLHYWRHLVAYFVFACSLAYATDDWDLDRWRKAAFVILIAALYGIAIETGQHVLPHRTPFLITDAIANVLGASLVLAWYLVRPYLALKPLRELVPW